MSHSLPLAEVELARLFDRHGPRYTSYPTAVEFHSGVDGTLYRAHLAAADARDPAAGDAGDPTTALSLYVHIPFCEQMCAFCACHVIATPRRDVAATYLGYLARELDLLAAELPVRRTLQQMHWGGGTPTYLTPAELETLFAAVTGRFAIAPGAEIAIEIDPRVTSVAHLETLAGLGFNRVSMGVQDFTPEVQEAIGRRQTLAETRSLMHAARALGFSEGINLDLVYGLPKQTAASFERNLALLLELRPDRIAMYSFAFVPWVRPHQKRLDGASLPNREEKLALYLMGRARLLDAGYVQVGIDHFALPEDELAVAAGSSRLARNFMGYTVQEASTLVAAGVSGIGDVGGAFFQNERKLAAYYAAIDAGRLPIERGYVLDDDDRVRQFVIRELLCNFAVDRDVVRRRFDVEFDSYFAAARAEVRRLETASGVALVAEEGSRLVLAEAGRLFARNVCMAFDRHLAALRDTTRTAYSRTI